jgi:hypothetical protein
MPGMEIRKRQRKKETEMTRFKGLKKATDDKVDDSNAF